MKVIGHRSRWRPRSRPLLPTRQKSRSTATPTVVRKPNQPGSLSRIPPPQCRCCTPRWHWVQYSVDYQTSTMKNRSPSFASGPGSYISKTRSLLSASVTLWRSIATDIYPPPSVVPATAAQSLSSFWRTVLLYCVLGLQCRIRLAGWVWHPIQEHSKWFGSTVNGLGTRRMAGKHYLIFRGVSSVL